MGPDDIEFLSEVFGISSIVVILIAIPFVYNFRIFYPKRRLSDEDERLRQNDLEARRQLIEKQTFEKKYLNILEGMLNWVATRLTRNKEHFEQNQAQKGWARSLFGVQPFTEGSYELCLKLALIYPWIAFFIVWVLGGSGEFGGLRIFPEDSDDIDRIITLFSFILIFWLLWQTFHSSGKKYLIYFAIFLVVILLTDAFAGVGVFAFAVAFASAGTLVFAFADAFAGAGVFTFVLAFAVVEAGAGAGASVFAFGVAGGFALVFVFVFDYIKEHYTTYLGAAGLWIIFNFFYLTASVSTLVWLSSESIPSSILVFLCVLPLINAFLDWLSLGFTRGFLYAIYLRTHSGWKALLFVLLDVVLAILFLATITSITVLLFAGVNALSISNGGDIIINLSELIKGLKNDFWALDYLWIHFMMLSTLIPTLIHFTVAASAAILVVPNKLRDSILKHWNDRGDARFGAFLYVSTVPMLGLAAPVLALWFLYSLLNMHGGMVRIELLNWVETLSTMFDSFV